eukprot:CAMPEP_0198237854 /NCGR_PEP_ID=MMETSP1446-20131203/3638_1 /TAXON_ID=1461542 ORGANISM="Unidentified sp, Strain CCMP2111" /NCGR_SAMPLE_ID=MMETSP1446 /ASSEMBLY_ACC=CAM_ASM_001112 /LENGTH=147 /DNA_ID=CAMNT_0043920131 /DNA_START=1378 /DNA_END=1821 /DNA_ORIENTATION=-
MTDSKAIFSYSICMFSVLTRSSRSSDSDEYWIPLNIATEKDVAVAIVSAETLPSESGTISDNDIHSMHPAANPLKKGKSVMNTLTNMKAGTARRGWGKDEKIAQSVKWVGLTFRAAITVAKAIPSGMLCTPMANESTSPLAKPLGPK